MRPVILLSLAAWFRWRCHCLQAVREEVPLCTHCLKGPLNNPSAPAFLHQDGASGRGEAGLFRGP